MAVWSTKELITEYHPDYVFSYITSLLRARLGGARDAMGAGRFPVVKVVTCELVN